METLAQLLIFSCNFVAKRFESENIKFCDEFPLMMRETAEK
jgi:hypothetical protein